MKRLFIAEKPNLAKAIVDGLGGGSRKDGYYLCGHDVVTWCFGHMLELYDPEDYNERYKRWSLDDLPIYNSPIKYKVKTSAKSQFNMIVKLIKDAETIIHAGDPDEEGQLIIDEILEYCDNKKSVLRFMTNDNNLKVVQNALSKLEDNTKFYSVYQSALARNVGDQLYGYNMTRAYTLSAQEKGFDGVLSVGRVQTPILGLVVNRDRANANHNKQYYFDVVGTFDFSTHAFSAKYVASDSAPVDDKNRITDKIFAEKVTHECRGKNASITNLDSSIKESSQRLPYNILKLQVEAAKIFNYKPDKVMKITQELREKYKLITYNGTDCQYLNEEQHADAKAVLAAISKTANEYSEIISKTDHTIKSRAFNNKNVSAHHAIIPTEATADITRLSEPEKNIYLMVAKAYIAQFYQKERYRETDVLLNCESHSFKTKSKAILSDGWKALYKKNSDDCIEDEDVISLDLSTLKDSQEGSCPIIEALGKETKPLPLYTMSTLLTDLTRVAKYIKDPDIKKLLVEKDKDKKDEHGGIGTSRTRDKIIIRLFKSGFIVEKGKKVISTPLAQQFFDTLPEIATSPDMTALWHQQQSMIVASDNTTKAFIGELMVFIAKQVEAVKLNGVNIKVESHKCPKCDDGQLTKRKSSNGTFWPCNRYPDCNGKVPDKGGKPDYKSLERHPCPSCKKPMKRIKGSNGFFWAHESTTSCKITLQDNKGKPKTKVSVDKTEHLCGDCQKRLIRRVSVKGKGVNKKSTTWYGCSGFPACKKTYFDLNGKPKY